MHQGHRLGLPRSRTPRKASDSARRNRRERFLHPEEIARLVESCGKEPAAPYLKSVVTIALHTGLRKKELLSLRREQIYMDRDMIRVEEGKGGYDRFVHLHPTAKREVAKLLLKGKSEYFLHDRDGEPFKT